MFMLKQEVKGRVHFDFYRDGVLYYRTDSGFVFEVPISDTGKGTFLKEDKAIFFMRWLRPAIEAINKDLRDRV